MIQIKLATKSETKKYIKKFLEIESGLSPLNSFNSYTSLYERLLSDLIDEVVFAIEEPYIDRLYRDTYYQYFSSKLGIYERDCLRICIFRKKINAEWIETYDQVNLQKNFLGFFVIRPIKCALGRNVISPLAFKERGYFIRQVDIAVNLNGIKLIVKGFPHSSQDTEAMTCAETALWSLLEYFGTKYHQYSTILPSDIRSMLTNNEYERMLPSAGLSLESISHVLTKLGFGSRVYTRDSYSQNGNGNGNGNGNEFFKTMNTYIESGIPLIVNVNNDNVSHVYLSIGRTWINEKDLKNSKGIPNLEAILRDFDSAEREIVIIDDNSTPYNRVTFNLPIKYIDREEWKDASIEAFIAPLHSKIYLEAQLAKDCFINAVSAFEKENIFELKKKRDNFMRTFLSSSRTFKASISKSKSIDWTLREKILKLSLPQYIWIIEISSEKLFSNMKADGLAILDATEPQIDDFKALILLSSEKTLLLKDKSKENKANINGFRRISVDLQPFYMFNSNLKLYK